MKVLILGNGRHGKDTVAELLQQRTSLNFASSSEFAAKHFIFDSIKSVLGYSTISECYRDRHNNRGLWYELICAYNRKDKARLCKELIKKHDLYVGMRCNEEYKATKYLFNVILWVHAFDRVEYRDPTMKIEQDDRMIAIDNNGTPADLARKIDQLVLSGVFK